MRRKKQIVTGDIHHVYARSIAGYQVFNNEGEYERMCSAFAYYIRRHPAVPFSKCLNSKSKEIKVNGEHIPIQPQSEQSEIIVDVIAYCVMPTHIHLILRQRDEEGIATFMGNVLNSYTKFFNLRHKRKGPLWEGPFENVPVVSEEQLLHLTRYVHLNPVTARLVEKPEQWAASSYREYINGTGDDKICVYEDLLEIETGDYSRYVESRIDEQRELALIKHLMIDGE